MKAELYYLLFFDKWCQVKSNKVMSKKLVESKLHTVFPPFVDVDTKGGERAIRYERIESDIKDLAGKILTIIDASIADVQQNKAIKDLVKTDIRECLYYFQDICYRGSQGNSINF